DLGQRELVELDQKAQKKGLTPKEENRRKQLLGEIGYAQRQATQLESYLEMLMTERKDHWNNVRDDMFLNYVVKTSRRLYLKGKSPEYIQAFIEKTTLGE